MNIHKNIHKRKAIAMGLLAILIVSSIVVAEMEYVPAVQDQNATNIDEPDQETYYFSGMADTVDDDSLTWGESMRLNISIPVTVTVNLSEIGGSAVEPMVNIGGNIYSTTTNVSAGTLPKIYNLTVNATDIFGNSNTSVSIQLRVIRNGDATGNGIVQVGDALRCSNYLENPGYYYIYGGNSTIEVTGNGAVSNADCTRISNNVSYPGNPAYFLD